MVGNSSARGAYRRSGAAACQFLGPGPRCAAATQPAADARRAPRSQRRCGVRRDRAATRCPRRATAAGASTAAARRPSPAGGRAPAPQPNRRAAQAGGEAHRPSAARRRSRPCPATRRECARLKISSATGARSRCSVHIPPVRPFGHARGTMATRTARCAYKAIWPSSSRIPNTHAVPMPSRIATAPASLATGRSSASSRKNRNHSTAQANQQTPR